MSEIKEPLLITSFEEFDNTRGKLPYLFKIKFFCKICGKEQILTRKSFKDFICSKCLRNENIINKYGDLKTFNNERTKKAIKTKEEKYGSAFGNQEKAHFILNNKNFEDKQLIQNKRACTFKQTCINKYGVDNPAKSKEVLEKMKQTCINKYGVDNPAKIREFNQKSKYFYNNLFFDSSYELAYYIWLTDNNKNFIYHPDMSFHYIVEEKEHLYFPDFLVEEEFVEIKGAQFLKNGTMINPYGDGSDNNIYKAKFDCMIKNNVKILSNKECKVYIDYIKNNYGKTFLVNHRATSTRNYESPSEQ